MTATNSFLSSPLVAQYMRAEFQAMQPESNISRGNQDNPAGWVQFRASKCPNGSLQHRHHLSGTLPSDQNRTPTTCHTFSSQAVTVMTSSTLAWSEMAGHLLTELASAEQDVVPFHSQVSRWR